MLFNVEFWNMQKYLPTKRHRKLRERYVKNNVDVEIKEVTENEFPVAFIVHDYKTVYENAKCYDDFNGNGEYKMFSEEIRTYDGKLYMPVRVTHGAAISLCFEPLEYIKKQIEMYGNFIIAQKEIWKPFSEGGEEFTEESIIKEYDIADCQKIIFDRAENYILYSGKVWETCGEPMYNITTFGLGHNHGGTGFFIQYCYNPNISNKNYFNALEREKAIAYGKKVAADRGDTDSVDRMGKYDIIEVLMPEMVHRNPQKEHGDGDPFMNSLENMISGTESSAEAGLLAIAMCMSGAEG